ncbi:signal peptidase I [Macrococcus hajekii]|uniref:signal peptidase I n=1 Tax=Macrococcus hajekii TaxID=198482 RepID=UPI0014083E39|nr:signal peptidase I [Macrococcus hajekii]GGA99039.1 signal peptidase I [Macrococcus hajekii]
MKRGLFYVLFIVTWIILFRTFLLGSYIVDGRSMEPTLKNGERAVVNIVADLVRPLKSGDIIFFRMNNETYVKRIAAAPGDYMMLHQGYLYVNGERFSDQQVDYSKLTTISDPVIPEKCYIVLGDNLKDSVDSRAYGCIAERDIMGKVIGHFDFKLNE